MALAVVQSTSIVGSAVNQVTTPAISTTTGNLVVVDIVNFTNGNFTSLGDSVGLSWSESIARTDAPADGNGASARQRYAQITTGNASHTFVMDSASVDYPAVAVKEISGAAPSSVLAEVNSGVDIAQTSHTLSLTTAIQNDCILCAFGACGNEPGAENPTQTGTFLQDQNIGTYLLNELLLSSHKIISATGSNAFTFTTPSGDDFAMGIAAFKMAAVPVTFKKNLRRNAKSIRKQSIQPSRGMHV